MWCSRNRRCAYLLYSMLPRFGFKLLAGRQVHGVYRIFQLVASCFYYFSLYINEVIFDVEYL